MDQDDRLKLSEIEQALECRAVLAETQREDLMTIIDWLASMHFTSRVAVRVHDFAHALVDPNAAVYEPERTATGLEMAATWAQLLQQNPTPGSPDPDIGRRLEDLVKRYRMANSGN